MAHKDDVWGDAVVLRMGGDSSHDKTVKLMERAKDAMCDWRAYKREMENDAAHSERYRILAKQRFTHALVEMSVLFDYLKSHLTEEERTEFAKFCKETLAV